MNASSNAAGGAPLSKEEINDLPMLAYEGEVMLVQTEGEMARALNFLKKETLLGFDTESRPSFKKGKSYPTSLIQLAGSELVVLIRLNLTPFCGALAGLLADPGIIKAGVAIRDDIRALQKLHEFTRRACDRRDGETARHQGAGLTLAAQLMGCRISKAAQCSTGRKDPHAAAIRYAATDAWIGREIYLRMMDQG
ncbi:MAG: 3'-5' exonuclease [Bilophila wadsworthia]